MRRCVLEEEFHDILHHCHVSPYGGQTASKVLQARFIGLLSFGTAMNFLKHCNRCQRVGNISRHHDLPLTNILEIELFDVWGVDFMGSFPPSFG